MSTSSILITTDVPPNQTLFCCNVNTKINTRDLKSCLFELFCRHGKILDVVVSKADAKKRGIAFIVFASVVSATTAMRSLQGKIFLGRAITISYAKTKSDKIALLDGTYRMRKPQANRILRTSAEPEQLLPLPKGSPGATLFVENLPNIINETALTILFKQYPGFQEVRLIPGRAVAFVDFGNELQAEIAIKGLNNFLVTPDKALKISLAKSNA